MSDDPIADGVLRAIRRILQTTSEHSRQLARDTGLTVPQLLCLRAVAAADQGQEVTVAGVGQAVQLTAATVSRILDRLERAGLVVRERRSPDRRKVCLSLTEVGRQRLVQVPVLLQERFVARLGQLPRAQRLELLRALEQVVALMEAERLDAAPLLDSHLPVEAPCR